MNYLLHWERTSPVQRPQHRGLALEVLQQLLPQPADRAGRQHRAARRRAAEPDGLDRDGRAAPHGAADLGFSRIVFSDKEVPILLVNLV